MNFKADKNKLSDKEEMFCIEYVKDCNGTQAAIRAGYSADSAASQASRMLKKSKVRARIDILKSNRLKKSYVDREDVVIMLKEVVNKSINGKRLDSFGATKALELLGKNLGMFTDKIDVNANLIYEIKDPFTEDSEE